MERGNHIKVLYKAATVLQCFEQQSDWSLTELQGHLGWHMATLHRILGTLEGIGYLSQDPVTRRYRLGLALVKLGRRAAEELDLSKVAAPVMTELSTACGETVYLANLHSGEVVYLGVAQANRPVRLTAEIGERRPAHSTGTGKVLLAYAPGSVLEQALSRALTPLTEQTIINPAALRAELATIRKRGYAVSYQEHDRDVASLAAPIYDSSGPVAALAISGPAFRLPSDLLHRLAPTLLEAARRISGLLGHQGGGAER